MEQTTLIEQPESAPAPQPTTDRDVQRATLRDLLTLATECATTENEIERRYRIESEAEDARAERLLRDITQKSSNLREKIKQTHEQTVRAAMAAYQAAIAQAKARDEELRRKVTDKHAMTIADVKKKYEQAVWLADSVLENEQNGAAVDYKTAKELIETQRGTLAVLEKKGLELLYTYGATVTPPDEQELERDKAATPAPEAAEAVYNAQHASAEQQLAHLGSMALPKLFVGITPFLAVVMACVIVGVATQLIMGGDHPQWIPLGIAVGGTLAVMIAVGLMLRGMARRKVIEAYLPFRQALAVAEHAMAAELTFAATNRDERLRVAQHRRKLEVKTAKEKHEPFLSDAARKRDASLEVVKRDNEKGLADIAAARDKAISDAKDSGRAQLVEIQQKEERENKRAREQHEHRTALIKQNYDQARGALSNRLDDGLTKIRVPSVNGDGQLPLTWDEAYWKNFVPPTVFPQTVRFGELTVDLRRVAEQGVANEAKPAPEPPRYGDGTDAEEEAAPSSNGNGAATTSHLQLPPPFSVPATLSFPQYGSLLIQTDREGRPEAIRAMQMVMARLLTTLPAGRVRFTIIDPIGRGENFAGFMHLADHDDALVGARIWTEVDQIEQRLADMTEHMETVIQKYLRNEYLTIDEYNAQAGELAEPYRVLVIADFPTGFEGEAAKRLASIASSGARCGVFTLVLHDTRQEMPSGSHLDELEHHGINIIQANGRFAVKDEIFGLFPLTLDPPPSEDVLTSILDIVGKGAKAAKRVELPFDNIAPTVETLWSQSSASELACPVGRSGATKLQYVRLGRGVAQHMIIAGKTGSGKSTLLNAMITNIAMWYSPDEAEFYLIDFKKGVEFKTYATHHLPHARAIAVESDREFGLSVLQRLDGELTKRGNLYRKVGTQDLAAYRKSPGAVRMPRTLLIIDEFQEFFTEDDKVAQDASLLLDRLVRQGRAFGIHVILGSQTIGGSSGLPRSTIGQMAVRVALMTSEADSQLILGDNNSAARLLSRPGEAIYNDAGGLPENNSPFQVAWLPDAKRDEYLDRIQSRAVSTGIEGRDAAIVFEGNAAADIKANVRLAELIDAPTYPPSPPATYAYLGDPVAIKDPSAVVFRRQSGANSLIVGQNDDGSMALMTISMISLAAQQAPGRAIFYVLDGSPADSPLLGVFQRVKEALPHEVKLIDYRQVGEAIDEVAKEVQRRQTSDDADPPSIYIMIYGLQRYRMLRKSEDSFSFGGGDADKPPAPDKQFTEILREGPAMGVHIITWVDTPASLERSLDRTSLREFDTRILFQMSANDSSNLIDSPAGNKLGQNRSLIYSEEQGMMEKFRPYAIPDREWLAYVHGKLTAKKV